MSAAMRTTCPRDGAPLKPHGPNEGEVEYFVCPDCGYGYTPAFLRDALPAALDAMWLRRPD